MSQGIITLETLSCPSCLQKIENAVKAVQGVDKSSVKVLFNASKVKLDFDKAVVSIDQVGQAIEDLGYGVIKTKVK